MRRFKQRKSAADINIALRQVAMTAAKRFPYYHDLMQSAGVCPSEVRNLETLRRLPITNKTEILSQLWSHCSEKRFPKLNKVKWSTSGTSGPVLLVYMSKMESLFRSLSYFQSVRENACFSWPLRITHVGAGERESKKKPSLVQSLARVKITRICRLLPEEQQIAELIESRPQIVTGHPSCLEVVAAQMIESNVVLSTKVVVCRGEVLSKRLRALLAQAFDGKIVDYYNAEEIGNIAYECPAEAGKMHINTDCCILEILDERGAPQPSGIEGRIVVTNLFNHTMPFIRYDLGDRGTLISSGGTRCDCGSLLPSILPPSGRSGDFFSFPSGVRLSPRAVESLVVPTLLRIQQARSPGVQGSPAYQCIQDSESHIRLVIASPLPFREELRDKIESNFNRMGIRISLTITEVREIPTEGSGKSRRVISKVRGNPPDASHG